MTWYGLSDYHIHAYEPTKTWYNVPADRVRFFCPPQKRIRSARTQHTLCLGRRTADITTPSGIVAKRRGGQPTHSIDRIWTAFRMVVRMLYMYALLARTVLWRNNSSPVILCVIHTVSLSIYYCGWYLPPRGEGGGGTHNTWGNGDVPRKRGCFGNFFPN